MSANLPAAHSVQDVCPVNGVKDPDAHATQVAPVLLLAEPAGQALQLFGAAANVPGVRREEKRRVRNQRVRGS